MPSPHLLFKPRGVLLSPESKCSSGVLERRRGRQSTVFLWVWPWSSLVRRGPVQSISHPEGQRLTLPCQTCHSSFGKWPSGAHFVPYTGTTEIQSASLVLAQCKLAVRSALEVIICKHSGNRTRFSANNWSPWCDCRVFELTVYWQASVALALT